MKLPARSARYSTGLPDAVSVFVSSTCERPRPAGIYSTSGSLPQPLVTQRSFGDLRMYRRFASIVVLMVSASASAQPVLADEWGISGLEIVSKPTPIIDIPRIRAQQAVGCAVTTV